MYNDYGSLARDREEGNLNCADFLLKDLDSADQTKTGLKRARASSRQEQGEAKRQKTAAGYGERMVESEDAVAKEKLMGLAQFERQCMQLALARLKNTGFEGKMLEALLLFIDVTDLFGQIFVLKDIGTRTV
jgi:hypothetical protein